MSSSSEFASDKDCSLKESSASMSLGMPVFPQSPARDSSMPLPLICQANASPGASAPSMSPDEPSAAAEATLLLLLSCKSFVPVPVTGSATDEADAQRDFFGGRRLSCGDGGGGTLPASCPPDIASRSVAKKRGS